MLHLIIVNETCIRYSEPYCLNDGLFRLIFASIVCAKHSSQAINLFRYMAMIRKGAERSPRSSYWREYDAQFRLKRFIDSNLRWGFMDAEL